MRDKINVPFIYFKGVKKLFVKIETYANVYIKIVCYQTVREIID